MMKQYLGVKAAHPQAVLLFRMGDFYETFFEDAEILSRVTGITLTSRNAGEPDPIPLAGFPWHSSEGHIARLLEAGHRVAICEQVEEPGPGKKLLERKVVEILSPGTAVGESQLDRSRSNYIVAISSKGALIGMAAAEISTGDLWLGDLSPQHAAEEYQRLAPVEVLGTASDEEILREWNREAVRPPLQQQLEDWRFARDRGHEILLDLAEVATLDAFECEDLGPGLAAAGALLEYAREQKQSELRHLRHIRRLRPGQGLILDESTLRSLEVLEPMPGGPRDSTLIGAIDRTLTAAGARRLRGELRRPQTDRAVLETRYDGVERLLEETSRQRLRNHLKRTADIERVLARLHVGRANPRDLGALRNTLAELPDIRAVIEGAGDDLLPNLDEVACQELAATLQGALLDEVPTHLHAGGIFRDEWDPELSSLRTLARDAKSWILRLQEREREATGIANLKVAFNKVFGYYIEVTKSHQAKVPERYQRKQTLVNAERYLTPELKEFEQKVLSAEDDQIRKERNLFEELCNQVRVETAVLQKLARRLAEVDLLQSFADLAQKQNYVRPRLVEEPRLHLTEARHPVIEQSLGQGQFIPNDVELDSTEQQLAILTGPNMAGKSTYLRQAGLLVVLAQIGSFVPAKDAEIGICDRVFTRVGAQDSLAKGQSTFLLEMIETSRILHHATERSLVLLDEVGRGTSTYDGLAIAWAVAESIADPNTPRPRTVFATHFHELVKLADSHAGVFNLNVQVKEWGDRVIFVRKVVAGGADRSYGIAVARLAGVPDPVIARAREVLGTLERQGDETAERVDPTPERSDQLSLFSPPDPSWVREFRDIDLDRLSPLEALQILHRWRSASEVSGAATNRVHSE